MPQTALAGLPRLVRVAGEVRWRGQCAIGMALAVAGFWTASWLLDQGMRATPSLLAAAAIALPTALVTLLAAPRRVHEALRASRPPPRASLHETLADARERRTGVAGIVLTGIIVLLLFDQATGGGGVMAGLVVGLLGALGASDVREAGMWDAAEAERAVRLFALVRPRALLTGMGATEVYETPAGDRHALEPTPFDLGI